MYEYYYGQDGWESCASCGKKSTAGVTEDYVYGLVTVTMPQYILIKGGSIFLQPNRVILNLTDEMRSELESRNFIQLLPLNLARNHNGYFI